MEKKIYETPQLNSLGSVQELTANTGPPSNGSGLEDCGTVDGTCEILNP
jgi:hypothetical protein